MVQHPKVSGSQLRNTSYRVKHNECYKVPVVTGTYGKRYPTNNSSDDEDTPLSPVPSPIML